MAKYENIHMFSLLLRDGRKRKAMTNICWSFPLLFAPPQTAGFQRRLALNPAPVLPAGEVRWLVRRPSLPRLKLIISWSDAMTSDSCKGEVNEPF